MSREWYVQVGDKQYGPISSAQLKQWADERRISPECWVREKDGGQWVEAGEFPSLFPAPAASVPQPVPAGESEKSYLAFLSQKTFDRGAIRTRLRLDGRQGKSVIVDGSTIKIVKKGGILATQRDKVLPIRGITSVEVKKPGPFVVGYIQFCMAGRIPRDSSFTVTGGTFDAVQDENSVVFAGDDKYKLALEIKDYIENYAQTDGQAINVPPSVADEIVKFKSLMDEGILTKEEFEAKKRQLLGT